MATVPYSSDADRGEARFFFTMACLMAATIVAGFTMNLAMGISSFRVPWFVHVHAFVMFGWVAALVVLMRRYPRHPLAVIFGMSAVVAALMAAVSLLLALMVFGLEPAVQLAETEIRRAAENGFSATEVARAVAEEKKLAEAKMTAVANRMIGTLSKRDIKSTGFGIATP